MTDSYAVLVRLMDKFPVSQSEQKYLLSKISYWMPRDFMRWFYSELKNMGKL